jgi:hypothetical protein
VLWDADTGKAIKSLTVDGTPVTGMGYSEKMKKLVVGTEGGSLVNLDVNTLKKMVINRGDDVASVAVAPAGDIVVVGYGNENRGSNDRINRGIVLIHSLKP